MGAEAKEVLEALLAGIREREVAFSILFCAEEHEIERGNYEEESFGEDSIDEEIHRNSGSFDIDALQEQEQNQQEQEERQQRRQHQLYHNEEEQEDNAEEDRRVERVPLADAASLLKSSVMSMSTSLASKYRHLRGTSGSGSGVKTATTGDGEDTEEEEEEEEEEYEYNGEEEGHGGYDGYEAMVMSDNMFDLLLPGRSPPFVFDLHADGSSVVVVKLVGSKNSMDPRLKEGCVVRGINGRAVYCGCRQDFDKMLAMVTSHTLYFCIFFAFCWLFTTPLQPIPNICTFTTLVM